MSVVFKGNGNNDLLWLSNASNKTFSGTVTLDNAGLEISDDHALGYYANDIEVKGDSGISYSNSVTHSNYRTFKLHSGSTLGLYAFDGDGVTIDGAIQSVSGSATLEIGTGGANANYEYFATLNGAATFSGTLRLYGYLRVPNLANLSPNAKLVLGCNGNHTAAVEDAGSMIETSGTFSMPVGTGYGQVQWANHDSYGSGGFAAVGGDLTIRFGGGNTPVTWGSDGFLPNANASLVFQTNNSTGVVYFDNGIALNGAQRTIQTNAGSPNGTRTTILRRPLTGNLASGLNKTGSGTLHLFANNTYGGPTTVSAGYLVADGNQALGDVTGGTTVASGATLTVATGRVITGETLTLHGIGKDAAGALQVVEVGNNQPSAEWQGQVRIGSDGARIGFGGLQTRSLIVSGEVVNDNPPATDTRFSVSGGYGVVALTNNNNSFAMPKGIRVFSGKLSFTSIRDVGAGNSALGAPSTAAEGQIDLGDYSSPGRLVYTGTGHSSNRMLYLSGTTGGAIIEAAGSGALVLTGGVGFATGGAKGIQLDSSSFYSNEIRFPIVDGASGATTLWKTGAGVWLLTGASTHTGPTFIQEGQFEVNGSLASSPATVYDGATLGGTGSLGAGIAINARGRLYPGSYANPAGNLTASNLTFASGAIFAVKVNQAQATIGRITTSSPLSVTGVTFGLGSTGPLAVIPANTRLKIISYPNNLTGPSNLSGTFVGYPEGAVFKDSGNTYRINYQVDTDGNGKPDAVTLTALGNNFEAWGSIQGLNSGNNGPTQDPDNDSNNNLLEFFLGGNPLVPDAAISPDSSLTNGELRFQFTRNRESLSVASLFCEWTTDGMATWNRVGIGTESYGPTAQGVTVTVVSGPPDAVTVRIPATASEVFVRLAVSQP